MTFTLVYWSLGGRSHQGSDHINTFCDWANFDAKWPGLFALLLVFPVQVRSSTTLLPQPSCTGEFLVSGRWFFPSFLDFIEFDWVLFGLEGLYLIQLFSLLVLDWFSLVEIVLYSFIVLIVIKIIMIWKY